MTRMPFRSLAGALLIALPAGPTTADQAGEASPIVKYVVVDAPRAEVWKAFTTAEGVTSFFAPRARIELRLGGPYELLFLDKGEEGLRGSEGCTVLAFVPRRMLSFTWNAPPEFEDVRTQRSYVVLNFEDAGTNQTGVQLYHGGWGAGKQWTEVRDYFDRAWGSVLANLQRRFEEGPLLGGGEALPAKQVRHWVYFIRPVREDFFESGPTERERELIGRHAAYIKHLVARDKLVVAGPCGNDTLHPRAGSAVAFDLPAPGIVVFEASDETEARSIMEGDPAIDAGVFKACLCPFTLSFARP